MKIYLISALISIVMMILSAVTIYNIADYIDPPVTDDGHPYMPTENIAKSLIGSLILTAIAFIAAVKIQRERQKR
ncbi:hypothetical protein [Chryseobacterium sp. Bi04]|uniref:hypothetical protein n=1 Tax=Chryseobacterium sp. Bi04 TaxID=2822345 RepID=UPI001D499428|nr:hypothetical protein [Chryseobacterium sp. Bi04]CAH0292144.1 hypothetical protein SRABI04_04375 [Chryseobacterium sp. Bi04]